MQNKIFKFVAMITIRAAGYDQQGPIVAVCEPFGVRYLRNAGEPSFPCYLRRQTGREQANKGQNCGAHKKISGMSR
ncbi:MAG TPA: hypothetical protein PLT23_02685 [Lentisphaeria bacterium]|nr:hypothetical protein [Lentisphaeria bacterium]HQL86971.1 hypothetical protein [Lentisphaeria bacterium]